MDEVTNQKQELNNTINDNQDSDTSLDQNSIISKVGMNEEVEAKCENVNASITDNIVTKLDSKTHTNIPILKCCLHITDGICKEKIIPFNDETLSKCQNKQNLRLSRIGNKKSKYYDIKLPEAADGFLGYHSSCYRYFTAVSNTPLIRQTSSLLNDGNYQSTKSLKNIY